jgi:hypothetical protein
MAKLVQEFEFELETPVSVHKGGGLAPVTKLLLKAPTNAHRYQLTKLKQGFISALLSMQKTFAGAKGDDNEVFNGQVILMALLASDIDFAEYMNHFRDMISSGLCVVDGSINLTPHLFDQFSMEDSEALLGKYIENFLVSSVMKLLKSE